MARSRQASLLSFLQKWWLPLAVAVYFITHLPSLLALPTFADESIYIRWAQLLLQDPKYLYFSMNDGKPPLYMWLLASLLRLPANPVFIARAASVAIGLAQLFVSDRLVKSFGGTTLARVVSATLIIFAPFWFFHHRIALMDGLLTLFLTASVLCLHELHLSLQSTQKTHKNVLWAVLAGLFWGLALWTKIPALFIAPWFGLIAIWPFLDLTKKKLPNWNHFGKNLFFFGSAGAVGLAVFLLLKTQPIFGALFARGQDFTFTLPEVLSGQWRTSIDNAGRLIEWLSSYLRPEALSLAAISLLVTKNRKNILLLWLGAVIFAAPLALMGRTLHPRYFLPVMLFLTPVVALFFEEGWQLVEKAGEQKWLGQSILYLLIGFFFIGSLRFVTFSLFEPNQTPFVLADRSQYLTEWSSGHGIREVRDLMIGEVQKGNRVTVVTEGSFGTLPDALLLEFDRRPEIANLRIEGLAQYPVKYLPEWVFEEARDHQTWLVVNESRLEMSRDNLELLARYPRPYGASDLLLFAIHPPQTR
jgi:4-amino-4-deoxy-L-arabinose transferase-like glycosyltransferase